MKAEDVIGAWTLIDWRIVYPDGTITHPFGNSATGYIVYAANGVMTASICANPRGRFNKCNARDASAEQKSAAFDSYFHYAGAWRIEDDGVVHEVTMALNPDMTGTQQRRHAARDGDMLTLSTKEFATSGVVRHHILRWRRH
ncbi:MAG: lipocalin-like domain-containing protein [Gammaproteobacteria bacterium]|nr:lipocalin-like domain-containing protein [Gammaproteobacteria bacterium]